MKSKKSNRVLITIMVLLLVGVLLLTACGEDDAEPTPTLVPPTQPVMVATNTPVPVVSDQRAELTSQTWAWVRHFDQAVGTSDIADPQNYTISFLADSTVQVKADCNNASGSFTTSGDSLTVALGPTTMVACAPESRSDQFLALLGGAAKYQIGDGQLQIELMADAGSLFFIPESTVIVPATAVPPTTAPATAVPPTTAPSLPGSVVDNGPTTYASGVYQAPYYTVANGDTLYSISVRFGISVAQISAANNLVNNYIYEGQQLLISSGGAVNPPPSGVQYERVNFDAGSISAVRNGVINNAQPSGYVLRVMAGQTMEVATSSSADPLEIIVQTANGQLLPVNGENRQVQNNTWVSVPSTDDYFITVRPVNQPEGPSMNFTITFVVQ